MGHTAVMRDAARARVCMKSVSSPGPAAATLRPPLQGNSPRPAYPRGAGIALICASETFIFGDTLQRLGHGRLR